MDYNTLDNTIKSIVEDDMGLGYLHDVEDRFNRYEGIFAACWTFPYHWKGPTGSSDAVATLQEIWTVNAWVVDQMPSDWSMELAQPIFNTQGRNAKEILSRIQLNKDIGVVQNWKINPILQKTTKTTAGVWLTFEIIAPGTIIEDC